MTSVAERWAGFLTAHPRAVIAVMLVATALVGAGAPMVEESTDIARFEVDSPAVNASTYIGANFVPEGGENLTTIQVIRRGEDGEDVLTRTELIDSLELQREIRSHPDIGPMLAEQEPMTGLGNVLALYSLQGLLETLDLEGIRPDDLSRLDERERAALADLLGFEGASRDTVAELFGTLAELDGGADGAGFDAGNWTDASPEEVAQFATALGFDSEMEQETVVELVAVLSADEPPVAVDDLTAATDAQAGAITTLLGVGTLPPDDCLAALGQRQRADGPRQQQAAPPLSCQVWALQEMDDGAFESAIEAVLGPDGQSDALALVPQSYDPGSTTATAHNIFITQRTEGGSLEDPDGFSENVTDAQLELRALAENRDREYLMFGLGVLNVEMDQSLEDSTALVAPIAFLFVIAVLAVVYRDLLDILLGVAGIATVLIWTFGFMGWTGIPFNQLMISVPVLLIGLSIDFALHVFMRHRERRGPRTGVREAMRVALGSVIVALAWVTATTAIGFLSNLISPIGPLQEFGITSAFGIVAALLVFGALVPAVKVELDSFLESRGRNRRKEAFGTGGSWLSTVLETGAVAARRAPLAVLAVALVLSAVGVYGGTHIDTSFQEEDFIAEDPPDWTGQLPEPFATSEYRVTQDLDYLDGNFQQVGREGELLIRGDVTDDRVLRWLESAAANASEQDTTYILPNGDPDVRSPLREMRVTASLNPDSAFNESLASHDGIPDGNISGLYDGMTGVNPVSSEVVYAEDGEYEAIRMQVGIASGISQEAATADLQRVATHLEAESGGELDVVATGDLVVNTEIERNLFRTVTRSLFVTLIAVFVFLMIAYWLAGNTASLGVVTLLPVLFSVTWILGTMWLVGMPFNALTGTIAALTIGLGIDYSIHVSDRYEQELRQRGDVWAALQATVTGTGGALLGTAATTVGGFGTLVVAILPALQQFGFITGLTIVYAFLASVLVLPSLLVLWTRYLGPSGEVLASAADESETAASDPTTAPDD